MPFFKMVQIKENTLKVVSEHAIDEKEAKNFLRLRRGGGSVLAASSRNASALAGGLSLTPGAGDWEVSQNRLCGYQHYHDVSGRFEGRHIFFGDPER